MEFQSPSGPSNVHLHTPGLNLDSLHDFGEGVGVDMRDFTHERDDLDPELATPQLQTSGMSSMPPTSIMTAANDDMFQAETGMDDEDDDDDEGGPKKRAKGAPGGFTYSDKDGEAGRRKIRIEYINDKSRRHITFSKRKAGIMKKAYELSILTGTQILLLVVSETGLVYTFTTTKLQPLVQKSEGKNLIQSCLNAPDGYGPDGLPLGAIGPTKAKNGGLAIRPHKLTAAASAALAQQAGGPDDTNGTGNGATDSQASLGIATPNRPKKRLPSSKHKKGSDSLTSPNGVHDDLPPVPSVPDMHRQSSPHLGMALASPISTNYTYPAHHYDQNGHGHHGHAHGGNTGQPGFYPPDYAYGYGHGHHPYANIGVNPNGLQSPYGAPPPHHAPHSSPGHRM